MPLGTDSIIANFAVFRKLKSIAKWMKKGTLSSDKFICIWECPCVQEILFSR